MDLQPIEPEEALEWYLQDRSDELAESTLKSHRRRLRAFIIWCEEQGIDNLNHLSGRHFSQFKIWRKEVYGKPNNVTLNTHLQTLRVFIRWCEGVDSVPRDLHEYVTPPSMAPDEDVRTVILESETAADVLRYLRKYQYATRDHTVIEVLWSTGMRAGALMSLDLCDFVAEPTPDDEANGPFLDIHHRPETGTPLKNGKRGERTVSLKPELTGLIEDYIRHHRWDKTDDYGREPLFSTLQGRMSNQSVRSTVYKVTRPCVYAGICPHEEIQDDCIAAQNYRLGSKCPSVLHPHAVRKGAITWARLNDVPLEAVSERMDVSPKILKKHYDHRTKKQQMESRRNYFDGL